MIAESERNWTEKVGARFKTLFMDLLSVLGYLSEN